MFRDRQIYGTPSNATPLTQSCRPYLDRLLLYYAMAVFVEDNRSISSIISPFRPQIAWLLKWRILDTGVAAWRRLGPETFAKMLQNSFANVLACLLLEWVTV